MSGGFMMNWSIRARMMFLAVAPLVMVTLIIGYYLTHSRMADVRQSLSERGDVIAKHLATAAEFGLFSGDVAMLKSLASTTSREPDVQSVVIQDAKRRVVVVLTNKPPKPVTDSVWRTPALLFKAPVLATGVRSLDYEKEFTSGNSPAAGLPPTETLGWIEVKVSMASTLAHQREILWKSLYIMIGGLAISMLIVFRIGRRMIDSLLRLKTVVHLLRAGRLSARVRFNEGGELGELAADINEMATALENSQQDLRRGIAEATNDLQETVKLIQVKNAELEVLRQEALKAGRAKAEFLAKMSHEIRTPLSAVVGFSKLLEKTAETQEQQEYTRTVCLASAQLMAIIDDILDFSRIEAGEIKLERIAFDPKDWIEDVIVMLSVSAHAKGLELVLLFHSDMPRLVVGDPMRLSQVLTNLVSNAIKFTQQGHVVVEVRCESQQGDTCLLRLSVMDSGIGIAAEQQEGLFDMFSQADGSIARRFGGTGLGLAITEKLVGVMGGGIGVESTPGQGSTFYFTLPFAQSSHDRRCLFGRALNCKKVLLYEVHPFARRALRNLLLSWGMEVFHADSRDDVARLLAGYHGADRPFDLMIMGLSSEEMKAMDLVAFIGAVRREYAGPMLLLLGKDAWSLPEPLARRGRIRWISKPARREAIYGNICDLLGILPEQSWQDAPPVEASLSGAGSLFPGLRVLVAEDNDFNRTLLVTLLRQHDVLVDAVMNGAEAVQRACSVPYDIIFLDVHMPVMDGIEAGRRIRAQCAGPRLAAIIALTADVFADSPEHAARVEMDDCMLKPVTEEKLCAILLKWLPTRRALAGLPAQQTTDTGRGIEAGVHPDPMTPEMRIRLVTDVRKQWDNLSAACHANDRDAMRNHAHQLHGVTGYFGMPDLARAAADLERVVQQGGDCEIEACMRDLECYIRDVIGRNGSAEKE